MSAAPDPDRDTCDDAAPADGAGRQDVRPDARVQGSPLRCHDREVSVRGKSRRLLEPGSGRPGPVRDDGRDFRKRGHHVLRVDLLWLSLDAFRGRAELRAACVRLPGDAFRRSAELEDAAGDRGHRGSGLAVAHQNIFAREEAARYADLLPELSLLDLHRGGDGAAWTELRL